MRRSLFILLFFLAATSAESAAQQPAPQQPPPAQPPANQTPTQAPAPTQQAPAVPPIPAPVPEHRFSVVVLDPAHGGTDPGAHGAGDAVEKDMVLIIARVVRIDLERQGYSVVMTRDNDQNPSFEDRAAIANAHPGAVFISFHVSSTGIVGTARAYSYQFPNPAQIPVSGSPHPAVAAPAPPPAGWTSWNLAQKSHADLSRRLADVLQVEMSQKFKGSPEISSTVAVRGLRSIAEPAVAVELSNVAVDDPKKVEGMAPSLATAIIRALAAFRPVYEGAR